MLLIYFRELEGVIVSPSCSIFRLKAPVLELCLLDSSLYLSQRTPPLQGVKATSRAGSSNSGAGAGSGGSGSGSPIPLPPQGDQQVAAH